MKRVNEVVLGNMDVQRHRIFLGEEYKWFPTNIRITPDDYGRPLKDQLRLRTTVRLSSPKDLPPKNLIAGTIYLAHFYGRLVTIQPLSMFDHKTHREGIMRPVVVRVKAPSREYGTTDARRSLARLRKACRPKEKAMREIVFDTETTGLDPYQGHRLLEIGCIELVNRFPTGQTFHRHINPERDVPLEAFNVHGLSFEFLKDKPLFADVAAELVEFIGDAPLIAHDASFDLGFLNAEFERAGLPIVAWERLVDTLLLARRKYPGGPNRLDDLCQRFGIDSSRRTKHGALLDAEILAEVYLHLIGARQAQIRGLGAPA